MTLSPVARRRPLLRNSLAALVAAALTLVTAGPALAVVEPRESLDASSWGYNDAGQLGDGTKSARSRPGSVLGLPAGVRLTSVDAGTGHSLGIGDDGHTYAWGMNDRGQLGDGSVSAPSEATSSPVRVDLPAGITLATVSAGGSHSLGVTADGRLFVWGSNDLGQLGDGTTTSRDTPVEVTLPGGRLVLAASAGTDHSLGLDDLGAAHAWGGNTFGQLGDGSAAASSSPVRVELPTDVTLSAISAGGLHSLGLSSEGAAFAWGFNDTGQLGNGTFDSTGTPVRVLLPEGAALIEVSAGGRFSLGLTSDGAALSWGDNSQGQLGSEGYTSETSPRSVTVGIPTGTVLVAVSAGLEHALALTDQGAALAWGSHSVGQLGDGSNRTMTDSPTEVVRPGTASFRSVSAGGFHSLALATAPTTDELPAAVIPEVPLAALLPLAALAVGAAMLRRRTT